MRFILHPWQLFFLILSGRVNRRQQEIIDFQNAQIQALLSQMGKRRILLNDDQRRILAVKGKSIGRKALMELTTMVTPDTIMRWHRRLIAKKWDYRDRRRNGPGPPPVPDEMIRLVPRDDTIRKYMTKPRIPLEKSTTWLPFLRNHLDVPWAIDFFTVVTVNFSFLYVFVVFDHGRRKVTHLATTYNPTMGWVVQQLREATPFGRQPRYLFRDNDAIYGHGVRGFLDRIGIEEVRTAYRSPWQNAHLERFMRLSVWVKSPTMERQYRVHAGALKPCGTVC